MPPARGPRYEGPVWTRGWGFEMPTKKERPPGEFSGVNRRQWERVFVDLEVDYRSEDTFLFAYIKDISAMGIFVRTVAPEPPGTRLNLRFCPPGSGPIEVEGEVIWVNPYRPGDRENLHPGMGVKFVDMTGEQRDQIRDLVRTFAYLGDDDADDGVKQ